MKKLLIENTIKNILLLALLIGSYGRLLKLFKNIDPEHYDSLLMTITLLIMAVLFADYAFTYAHTRIKNLLDRYLSHVITFMIMLCTGLLLESVVMIVNLKTNLNVWLITFVSITFYASLVLYDYWDILRSEK